MEDTNCADEKCCDETKCCEPTADCPDPKEGCCDGCPETASE